ncbi:MAG: helix-turn-helix domain-containing protein [Hyphomicrobium sp.]|jgi:excisionase family DNA binding protein
MNKANNDDLIRAVFTATDEAKTKALAVLEGRDNPDFTSGPLLCTMGEAASLLNTSRATLWRILKRGRLQKVELYPGAFRLRRADVVALANGKVVARG